MTKKRQSNSIINMMEEENIDMLDIDSDKDIEEDSSEDSHHQAGPHGPQERIVGTQAGRHVQNQPDHGTALHWHGESGSTGPGRVAAARGSGVEPPFQRGQPRLLRRTL